MSCLGCQHFISDWLGKLKPNKLSTGCQNELKGAAVEKATNPGRRFLFFSRLRRSFWLALRANFAASTLVCAARQNRHATQAILRDPLLPRGSMLPAARSPTQYFATFANQIVKSLEDVGYRLRKLQQGNDACIRFVDKCDLKEVSALRLTQEK